VARQTNNYVVRLCQYVVHGKTGISLMSLAICCGIKNYIQYVLVLAAYGGHTEHLVFGICTTFRTILWRC